VLALRTADFHGMMVKPVISTLERTVWGLRQAATAQSWRGAPGSAGHNTGPIESRDRHAYFAVENRRIFGYPISDIWISPRSHPVPLYIKDDATARLVEKLAKTRGLSKQDAVKMAVSAELERTTDAVPLRERFAHIRAAYPLPPRTGQAADTAFFDDLSGGL
jgi:antitoxin VapB